MSFPSPTKAQARTLWFVATVFAVSLLLVLIGTVCWGAAWAVGQLSSVLLPLAVAGVIAYLLDPVVEWFDRHTKWSRDICILVVFLLAILLVGLVLALILPQIIVEVSILIDRVPSDKEAFGNVKESIGKWLEDSPLGQRAREAWDNSLADSTQGWLKTNWPLVTGWITKQISALASWGGFAVGLALVPVYVFYFLAEKKSINESWTDYLPLQESRTKEEVVFILKEINDRLITFFRSQVLVSMSVGFLLFIGYSFLGLNYGLLLALLAAVVGVIPYLGVMLSIIPAMIICIVQFGDWLHPVILLLIFGGVQLAESLWISPKIIGDRVGLHPLTIIIAVMVGTTLMGGIIGGVLAIPLTAALRTLMFRYIWNKRQQLKERAAALAALEDDEDDPGDGGDSSGDDSNDSDNEANDEPPAKPAPRKKAPARKATRKKSTKAKQKQGSPSGAR